MTSSPPIEDDAVNELVAIERALWSNDPEIYQDTYAPDAVLIFPVVGRLDRDTAVAAIREENARGRAWAEVHFGDVQALWISRIRWLCSPTLRQHVGTTSRRRRTLCAPRSMSERMTAGESRCTNRPRPTRAWLADAVHACV
jgi:hypothetical protein